MKVDDLDDVSDLCMELVRLGKLSRDQRVEAKVRLANYGIKGVHCQLYLNLISLFQQEKEIDQVKLEAFKREAANAMQLYSICEKLADKTAVDKIEIRTDVRADVAATAEGVGHVGDKGDKIDIGGSVQNSAVGSAAKFKARDIQAFQQAIEGSTLGTNDKAVFNQAAEALKAAKLPPGDEEDLRDDLAKLAAEAEKPERDEGRMAKILKRITDGAATVGIILKTADSLKDLVIG